MKAPQIIVIVLMSISLLTTAHDHGKPRKDNNFWTTLLSTAITFGLLVWGGFFNN